MSLKTVTAAILLETSADQLYDNVTLSGGTNTATVESRQGDSTSCVSGTNPEIGGQEAAPCASWTISGNEADGVTITVGAGGAGGACGDG